MENQSTIICRNLLPELETIIENISASNIFILCDTTTEKICLPVLLQSELLADAHLITIPAGDENKNIESAVKIWKYLSENGATRKSLMINLGGGMITDIGGFAASTFKRGIRYINISTTLLGAVDAATGGKTGINFLGLKNEIGVFAPANAVLIDVDFFKTLDIKNLRSGFAEMVKHALIDNRKEWNEILKFDLENVDFNILKDLVDRSVKIKERVVEQDPTEKNIRKALNLGHTFAHAFESLSYRQKRPVLHGYAVMWGLLCELYLSHVKLNFPKDDLLKLKYLIKEYYGTFIIDCDDYEPLFELMTHDKKNESKEINFTLLTDIGEIKINQTATKEEIYDCLDFFAGC
jgi:3-dehydroquinate synthase